MAESTMKSETQDEARARLEKLAEAEKRGTDAMGAGQLQVTRGIADSEDAVEHGKAYSAPANKMVAASKTDKK